MAMYSGSYGAHSENLVRWSRLDLHGVMAIFGKDHEPVGIVSVIVGASAIREKLVSGGESPGASDRS